MKTIDFSYFIERYNAGEMNEAERNWFEKELDSNGDLRDEVELRKKADKVLEDQALIQLRNKLAAIENTRSVPKPVRNHGNHPSIKYAAIFTGMILIGSLLLINQRTLTVDEIFEKFYSPFEIASPSRGIEADMNTDYVRAIEYYNVRDYRNAALYFSKIIENDPRNMESTLLYGVSNLEESNYPEAEKSFHKVRENDNSLYLEDAEWYLALCYLKTNEKEKAVDQFASIKESGSFYRKPAAKILRSIK